MSASKPTSYRELAEVLANLPLLVREKRRRDSLSIREAARQIGMSFATVARFEKGEDVVMSNAVKVLLWLGPAEDGA